jgi:hypothetical protein
MADTQTEAQETSSPKPADSIEVDDEVKDEEGGDTAGDGSDGLSRELYKEMRAICDTLTNHRIAIKGDE